MTTPTRCRRLLPAVLFVVAASLPAGRAAAQSTVQPGPPKAGAAAPSPTGGSPGKSAVFAGRPPPQPTPAAAQHRLTILAVYAHPDDGEFFAGGSLAKWAKAGHRVVAICATDGALGATRGGADPKQVAATRARELTAALAAIGAEPPIMLGYPDGFLRERAPQLRERLVYHYRRLKPDRIVTFDPWAHYEIHPDHIEAGRMASEAAVSSGFPLLHPEHAQQGLGAAQPAEVWYMGPLGHKPNRVVEVADLLDKKVAATLSHSSQIEMLADWFVPGANPQKLTAAQRGQLQGGTRQFLEQMGRANAQPFGGRVQLGETFFVLKTGHGHFDNYPQLFAEMLGAPADEPLIE